MEGDQVTPLPERCARVNETIEHLGNPFLCQVEVVAPLPSLLCVMLAGNKPCQTSDWIDQVVREVFAVLGHPCCIIKERAVDWNQFRVPRN